VLPWLEMKRDISWATAISLIAALLVMAYGFSQTPKYEATVRVFVGVHYRASPKAPATRAIEASLKKGSGGKIQLIPNATPESFQEISHRVATALATRAVAEETIRHLNLKMPPDNLLKNLTVEQEPATMFILVTYTDTEPKRARRVANTVGQIAHERARGLDLNAMDGGVITATLWQPAKLPVTPAIPNPFRNGLITLAIGLALSMVVIAIREYLRDNYR
jgi:capsular polysaccharide biosynthesis protein